jgi:hypothetical protein
MLFLVYLIAKAVGVAVRTVVNLVPGEPLDPPDIPTWHPETL